MWANFFSPYASIVLSLFALTYNFCCTHWRVRSVKSVRQRASLVWLCSKTLGRWLFKPCRGHILHGPSYVDLHNRELQMTKIGSWSIQGITRMEIDSTKGKCFLCMNTWSILTWQLCGWEYWAKPFVRGRSALQSSTKSWLVKNWLHFFTKRNWNVRLVFI